MSLPPVVDPDMKISAIPAPTITPPNRLDSSRSPVYMGNTGATTKSRITEQAMQVMAVLTANFRLR